MSIFKRFADWLKKSMDEGLLDEIKRKIKDFRQVPRTCSLGSISDGYHTFDELYAYRMTYNAMLFNEYAKQNLYEVHKSTKHFDGEECFGGGWFIVMATLPTGQISNHYRMEYWDLFNLPVQDRANEWDGHTPEMAHLRMLRFLQKG